MLVSLSRVSNKDHPQLKVSNKDHPQLNILELRRQRQSAHEVSGGLFGLGYQQSIHFCPLVYIRSHPWCIPEFLRLLHILAHRQTVNFFETIGEELMGLVSDPAGACIEHSLGRG
jgi:hypothetical protein